MSQPDRDTLAHHLAEVEYPCGREELLRRAAAAGGGDALLGPLGALPPGVDYAGLDAVWGAVSSAHPA
ncbi:DUF2795 domain-containing protein [Amycolatopsis sp. NBC_00345]|uniref:DUF2795 domain-containing protein n=1 Tax=Amycolatopsis sp. NBC_00345 TaxID=2975955 RepID=UPI002E2555DE